MPELPKIPPRIAGQRQNRESHINLGLIGRGLYVQAEEPGRLHTDQLQPIEEITASKDKSAPSKDFDQRQENANETGQALPVGNAALTSGAGSSRIARHESPWKTYEKGYDLKFDQFVVIAVRKAPGHGKVAIKTFTRQEASPKLDMIRRISHRRFVDLLEVFEFDNATYAVFEHIFTSLRQVAGSAAYPTERQLTAILGQILEGLGYLSSIGLQHGALCCSNVLLRPDGEIKISQDCCKFVDKPSASDVRAVGYIAMELMQKYAKEDGAIGIDNLNRWPADSEAVKFLSMTTSAGSVEELKKHALFKHPWRKEDLELLEELTFTARRAYRYWS